MRTVQWLFLSTFWASDASAQSDDYWSDNYDLEKNCNSEEIISQLDTETQCVENMITDPAEAIENCKIELYRKAASLCKATRIKSSGEMLYCKDRARTSCCFHKHECEGSWAAISSQMGQKAEAYLTDKDEFFKTMKSNGYKTCHPLGGYDASICHADCQEFEKSELADQCKQKGGLFKCCIRRDKAFCDECRFCCTVPFCSHPTNETEIVAHFGESNLPTEEGDQPNKVTAIEMLRSRESMYKGEDQRCLKPDSHKDPAKWEHYDPDDFVQAVDETQLKEANTTKFDKNFFNFESVDAFAEATSNPLDFFKKSYGYDFAGLIPDHLADASGQIQTLSQLEPCAADCLREEQSDFAKQCRKDRGFFKCCSVTLNLNDFEDARKLLKQKNLISSATNTCGEDGRAQACRACVVTYFCTIKDRYTGVIQQRFMSEAPNHLGGIQYFNQQTQQNERIPFRNSYCKKLDGCAALKSIDLDFIDYDFEQFYTASSKEDLCNANSTSDGKPYIDEHPATLEQCKKRKSNVNICPKKILKEIDNEKVTWINKIMRKFRKSLKKKGKKKKKKDKKKDGTKKKKNASK